MLWVKIFDLFLETRWSTFWFISLQIQVPVLISQQLLQILEYYIMQSFFEQRFSNQSSFDLFIFLPHFLSSDTSIRDNNSIFSCTCNSVCNLFFKNCHSSNFTNHRQEIDHFFSGAAKSVHFFHGRNCLEHTLHSSNRIAFCCTHWSRCPTFFLAPNVSNLEEVSRKKIINF